MIPFSLLCGKLNTIDGDFLEIRVLELSPDSFSIRLPKDYIEKHGKALSFILYFFERKKNVFNEVCISDFDIEITTKTDYYIICRILTDNDLFKENTKTLTRDYLSYIECKSTLDDNELASEYTDYPPLGDTYFCKTFDEQIQKFVNYVKASQLSESFDLPKGMELYIAIENAVNINNYLCKQKDSFINDYFLKSDFSFHPISKMKIKGLVVGNSYCYNLTPPIEVSERVIEKAMSEELEVIVAIPPVPQTKLDFYIEYYERLKEYNVFWQVNDVGMLSYIGKMAERGVLLNKAPRDPRFKYLNREEDNLMCSDSCVYIPYYQTNTGTFCPIHAMVNNGSRGNQERVTECNNICTINHFLYPTHLEMVGRYNSLFGFNKDVLCECTILERLINQGKNRVVINL